MSSFTQSFAQPGATCGTAVSLGNLRDSVYNLRLAYPQTEKWFSFTCDSSFINLYFGSVPVSNQKIKIDLINLYSSCSTNLTGKSSNPSPGIKTDKIEHSVTPSATYYLKIERYYNLLGTSIDTANKDVKLGVIEGNRSYTGSCATICANLLPNGGFECYESSSPFLPVFPFYTLYDWNYANGVANDADYFNSNFPGGNIYQAPVSSVGTLTFSPALSGNSSNYIFTNPSDGFIGIETVTGSSDIIELVFSPALTNTQDYYVSYDITAGEDYATFNDRIDLDVTTNTSYSVYSTGGYSPTIQSGPIGNTWTTKSKAFTATSGLEKIFIGNLAKQAYGTTSSGTGSGSAEYYFIDNVMLKPFEVELGSGPSVCAGTAIDDVIIPCEYLYPNATYTWSHIVGGSPVTIQTGTLITGSEGDLTGYTPSVTETLTLTITYSGLSTSDTYVITVLPGASGSIGVALNPVVPGALCQAGGVTSVIDNFVSTLEFTAPTATTYQWSLNGTPVSGATNQTFFAGLLMAGTHTVSVHTTTSGGCDADASVTFSVVENGCQLACATVLGTTSFSSTNFVSGTHAFPNATSSGFAALPHTGATYVVDGTLTLNSNTANTFTSCFFWMAPGARIVIEAAAGANPAAQLVLVSSELDGCVEMWDRIENRGELTASSQTTFNHAEAAIEVYINSSTDINSCHFRNNVVGIYSKKRVSSSARYALTQFDVTNTIFEGNATGFLTAFTATHSQYTGTTSSTPQAQPLFYLRPASGIMLKYISAVNIGAANGVTSNANTFRTMWNGISLNNCAAQVLNCSFDGMEVNTNHAQLSTVSGITTSGVLSTNPAISANYSSHYVNVNSNAISSILSTLDLYALEGNSSSSPTFKNCFRGLVNLTSTLNSTLTSGAGFETIFYRDVYTGIWIENSNATDILNVFSNDIEANTFGVMLRTNTSGCRIEIYENTITPIKKTAVSSGCYGIVEREINVNSADPNTVTVNVSTPAIRTIIRNNIIDGYGMNTGIEIKNSPRAAIRDNDITHYAFVSGGSAQNTYKGITLENCFSDTISCNRILDNCAIAYNTQDTANAAINCTVSPVTLITCNTTDEFRNGMLFRLNNAGTMMRGNAIMDHRYGIYYRKTPNGALANVGTQTHAGNAWQGTYTTLGAWFQGSPGISALSANEFRVDASINPDFMPPSITPASGWFSPTTAVNQFLCSDTLPDCNITRGEGERMDRNENLDYLNSIENDSSVYADENLWEAKNLLYKELKYATDSLGADSVFTDVLDSLESSNMAELEAIQYEIETLYAGTDSRSEEIRALATERNTVFSNWMQATTAADITQANLHALDLLAVNNALDSMLAIQDSLAAVKRIAIQARLDAYVPDNSRDESLIAILNVILNTRIQTGYANLADYESTINQVAYMCPSAGGEAVYLARVLNDILDDNASYNDDIICMADLNTRTSQRKNKEGYSNQAIQYATIYPNPTNGQLFVTSVKAAIKTIEVQDLTGRTVLTPTVNNNTMVSFSMEPLSKGVYFVKIALDNNTVENHKINLVE